MGALLQIFRMAGEGNFLRFSHTGLVSRFLRSVATSCCIIP